MTIAVLERPTLFDLPGLDRSNCPATRHGDVSAARHYRCICPDAKAAKSRYAKQQRHGKLAAALTDATGTRRRIQALYADWHSSAEIAAAAGMTPAAVVQLTQREKVTRENAERIRHAYEMLRNHRGTSQRRKSYPDPSMWDDLDIDDPSADPMLEPDPLYVDPVRIERALKGSRAAIEAFSTVEKDAFVEAYLEAGGSLTALTRALKCSGAAAKWLTKRMLGLQLLDIIKQREACGADWSDLRAAMVVVGAGYFAWDEEATARRVRNPAFRPANFSNTTQGDFSDVAEDAA